MHPTSSSAAARSLALAGALLSTSGCLTGVDVGQDGQGGHAAATGSGGSGGVAVTGASCTGPSQLFCAWGKPGGPCGGSRPNAKGCDAGWVCLGSTADTEGTCALAGDTLLDPGDPCVDLPSAACPWDYACDSTFFPGGAGGTCSPTNCSLDPADALVPAASITVDGDGATKHYDFACSWIWGSQLTGEANVHAGNLEQPPSREWLFMNGCGSPDGDPELGSIDIAAPLVDVGTVALGEISYTAPYVNGDSVGNYVNFPGDTMTFTVTELTPAVVRGTYVATVLNGGSPDAKHLTGTFDVCRLPYHQTP